MALSAAFTMAEILLSLTIIGVVAAITLPSLTGNINERTWNTQRKALYARMSQAIALMPSINSYGKLSLEQKDSEGNITQSAQDTATESFITEGLAKVLKINNICDNDHLGDCGIPDKISPFDGTSAVSLENIKTLQTYNTYFLGGSMTSIFKQDIKAAAFETVNGESILTYYNPKCQQYTEDNKGWEYMQPKLCVNFVYDLNGKKGPNAVGKDIGFITAFNPTDPIVIATTPSKITNFGGQITVSKYCKDNVSDSRIPNAQEATALFYNRRLVYNTTRYIVTGTITSSGTPREAFQIDFGRGLRASFTASTTGGNTLGICIKR